MNFYNFHKIQYFVSYGSLADVCESHSEVRPPNEIHNRRTNYSEVRPPNSLFLPLLFFIAV